MSLKKLALLLCLGLVFLLTACNDFTPTGANYYTPLVNEVYTGAASGQLQWVELYNNALDEKNVAREVDISGWNLVTSQGSIPLRGVLNGSLKYLTIVSSFNALTANLTRSLKDTENLSITALTGGVVNGDLDGHSDILNFKVVNKASNKISLEINAYNGSAGLGNLDPKNDVVVLKDENRQIIDQVSWGSPPTEVLATAGVVGNINLGLSAPADNSKSLGRTAPGTVKDGVSPNNPGHFTIHDTISPGNPVKPDTSKYTFFLATGTDVMTGFGGILLWLAFVMIAFIARRFQELAQQKTYWELLLGAPIGVAIYDIILVYAYTNNGGSLENFQKWLAFTPLFLSGVFCVWVINIFRLIAKNILEAE